MIDRVELRHLRYFVAVAEELHFGRAARRLGMAQPPLSLQIQRLESELGLRLLERTNRRVQLTDAGQYLLVESRRLLADIERIAEGTQRAARGETGSLTVAFASSVMFLSLPRIKEIAPGTHAQVFALCAEAGFNPRVVQVSREMYTTVSLVEAGMGVTIIPASVRKMGWRGVKYISIRSSKAITHIDAAWRADNKSPIVASLLEIVRATTRA